MKEIERETESSCPHTHTMRRVVISDFFKRQFMTELDECKECGAQVWTPDTRQRFHQWILELKHEKRDVFQIQFYLPEPARQGMREILKAYPGVPMSALIRAMTSVYLASMIRFADFQSVSNQVLELSSYRQVIEGRRKKTSLQFSPIALLDVQTWGEILKLSPHKVVEDAIYKFLALRMESEPHLKNYWDKKLWPQLEVILRSV